MARAEVIEVDGFRAREQREAILERAVGYADSTSAAWNSGILAMLAAVLACVTTSTFAGKNMLLPV